MMNISLAVLEESLRAMEMARLVLSEAGGKDAWEAYKALLHAGSKLEVELDRIRAEVRIEVRDAA